MLDVEVEEVSSPDGGESLRSFVACGQPSPRDELDIVFAAFQPEDAQQIVLFI